MNYTKSTLDKTMKKNKIKIIQINNTYLNYKKLRMNFSESRSNYT